MITFQSMQQEFERVFQAERKIPTSVTIAEADYNAFCESMFSPWEITDFERDLLGVERIAELESQRTAYQRQRVTHILCCITAKQIPFACNPDWPSGQVAYTWSQAEPPPERLLGSPPGPPRTFKYPIGLPVDFFTEKKVIETHGKDSNSLFERSCEYETGDSGSQS